MTIQDCFELGTLKKAHGLHGQLQILLDVDDPLRYTKLDAILVEDAGALVPYFVEKMYINSSHDRIKLEGVDTIDAAKLLAGRKVYLPLAALPPLEEDEVFLHDLVGFEVIDRSLGNIGQVENVYDLPNNTLLVLNYQEKEILLPTQEGVLLNINTQEKQLEIKLPEGLLDVYLSEEE